MPTRLICLHSTAALAAVLCAVMLGACTQSAELQAPPPKPVKVEVVGQAGAAGQTDSFVGTLRARQRSDLGFEAAGRVVAIHVEVGDQVKAGQVLARLDESPARWRLNNAQAESKAAAAALTERSTQLKQQEALAGDKIISATALESARAAHLQARSRLESADAALATARRDLALARITAPFDGEVVARLTQPFSDVASGQAVLQVQAGRTLEVVAMLPDAVASALVPGVKALGKSGAQTFSLILERLSARSDNGSLAQAIFRVQVPPASSGEAASSLRSGSVVSVELHRTKVAASMTLPMTAVMPGTKPGEASVFVLDEDSKIARRDIQTGSTLLPESRVAISHGLKPGEQVVVAGAAFLHEGQSVAVHQPETVLPGGAR